MLTTEVMITDLPEEKPAGGIPVGCQAAWAAWAECTKIHQDVSFHEELKQTGWQGFSPASLFS